MTNTATDKVRLGIIGLGAQGSMYAKFITDGMVPNMEIGAICDPDPAKDQIVQTEYPGVPYFTDYIAMLDSGEVDAVVIEILQTIGGKYHRDLQGDHFFLLNYYMQ